MYWLFNSADNSRSSNKEQKAELKELKPLTTTHLSLNGNNPLKALYQTISVPKNRK